MEERNRKGKNTGTGRWTQLAVFFFLLIPAAAAAVFQTAGNYDEIWNYTFGSCMAKGMLPYRDFNMLQTPLAAMINGLLFTIFGQHLLVMRLSGAVLFACTGTVLYRISVRLGASHWFAVLPGIAVILLFQGNIFFEYSGLMMFLEICMIDLDTTALERDGVPGRRFWILSGLPAGLAVLAKQTFGVFICVMSCFIAAMVCRAKGGRAGRAFVLRMAGCLIPCLALVIWLFACGIWNDFWDMCVRGISSFTAKYSYLDYLQDSAEAAMRGIALPLCLAIAYVIALRRRDRRMLILALYVTAGMINLYPLANGYHLCTTFSPALPAAAVCLNQLVCKLMRGSAPWTRAVSLCCLACALFYLLAAVPFSYRQNGNIVLHYRHLEGIFATSEQKKDIDYVHGIIEKALADGSDIIILDNRAQLYLMEYDIYHKNLDMFLLGNTGTETPEEVLRGSLEEGTYYLAAGKERDNTQFPRHAIDEFCKGLRVVSRGDGFVLYRAGEAEP